MHCTSSGFYHCVGHDVWFCETWSHLMQRPIVCSCWLVACIPRGVFRLMNERHGCHICYKQKMQSARKCQQNSPQFYNGRWCWVFTAIFFNFVNCLHFLHRNDSLLDYFSIHVEMEWRNPCLFEPEEQHCCCPKQQPHLLQPYFKQEMTQQVLYQAAAVHASSSSVISRSVWKLFEHTTYIHGGQRGSMWSWGCMACWQPCTNKTQEMPFIPTKSHTCMST